MSSAVLVRALAQGNVTVKNPDSTEVLVYYPDLKKGGGMKSRLIGPRETVSLTGETSVESLKRSPNLASLISSGMLRVE